MTKFTPDDISRIQQLGKKVTATIYKNIDYQIDISPDQYPPDCSSMIKNTFGKGCVDDDELSAIIGYRHETIWLQRDCGRGVKSFIISTPELDEEWSRLTGSDTTVWIPKYRYATCDIRDYIERCRHANTSLYTRVSKNWYPELYYYFDRPAPGMNHYI